MLHPPIVCMYVCVHMCVQDLEGSHPSEPVSLFALMKLSQKECMISSPGGRVTDF